MALVVVYLVLEVICAYALPQCGSRFLVPGEVNGEPVWRDNPFFAYRFYPPRTAPAPLPIVARQTPAPGTLRVCLLGGDALMGEPEPSFGPGRQLELMLRQRTPTTVEVIHLTLEGGNSHIMREVARDLERLRPQAVVIMIGNEEIAGPYGPASTLGWFHHSARLARTLVLFSRTHVSQLFAGLVGRVAPARVDLNVWRSQEPLMLKGRLAPDDPRLKSAYRAFNRNLRAILRLAKAAAPEVIVCTCRSTCAIAIRSSPPICPTRPLPSRCAKPCATPSPPMPPARPKPPASMPTSSAAIPPTPRRSSAPRASRWPMAAAPRRSTSLSARATPTACACAPIHAKTR